MELTVDTIFCDDVREELSGKQTLVGVYCSDIRTDHPSRISLHLWLRVSGLSNGEHEFDIGIIPPGKESPTTGGRGILEVVNDNYPIPIFFGPLEFMFEKEGHLVVHASFDGKTIEAGRIFMGFAPPVEEISASGVEL